MEYPEAPKDEFFDPPATTEIANIQTWGGKPLEPFSAGRQTALQRVKVIGGSEIEAACTMIRLRQMPPAEIAAIRGVEAVTAFHVELDEWMEREGIDCFGNKDKAKEAKRNAALKVYGDTLTNLYEAEKLEVAPKNGAPPSSGNE